MSNFKAFITRHDGEVVEIGRGTLGSREVEMKEVGRPRATLPSFPISGTVAMSSEGHVARFMKYMFFLSCLQRAMSSKHMFWKRYGTREIRGYTFLGSSRQVDLLGFDLDLLSSLETPFKWIPEGSKWS